MTSQAEHGCNAEAKQKRHSSDACSDNYPLVVNSLDSYRAPQQFTLPATSVCHGPPISGSHNQIKATRICGEVRSHICDVLVRATGPAHNSVIAMMEAGRTADGAPLHWE
jgi:hypothetical protein